MKLILILITTTALVATSATAVAHATASSAKLELRKTSIGTILVDSRGFTLYAFTKDGSTKDACATISGCGAIWPFVTTSGKPLVGPGVKSSLIGAIALNRKTRRVTYAGHPLYTYSADGGPGQTGYVNVSQFGGRWPALNAAGQEVK
jgi:predicted lipoprotein with Yx(FWY)xxD motif